MLRILPVGSLLILALVPGLLSAAEEGSAADPANAGPSITALAVEKQNGAFLASFRLESAFDSELMGKIASGLETSFEYRLEVVRNRRFWFDEKAVQRRIIASVKYDGLSQQYNLTLRMEGEVERSSTTDKPTEMQRWLTEIQGISLGPVSSFSPPEDFVVRVKLHLPPRFVLFFIPWNRDTSWTRTSLGVQSPDAHEFGK